ncbi:hypothetical protein [Bacillus thuringiensis]|uniref:hypothetical protein n=1 Tax=Bacillus thuringiensis TaxID=1428 RepID=UPI000BFC950A|nr:hypothetical protein [Bacillus thuringiensis]PGT90100.1 hypothetical protein COD17_10140 [Bacillus thuringiensis]
MCNIQTITIQGCVSTPSIRRHIRENKFVFLTSESRRHWVSTLQNILRPFNMGEMVVGYDADLLSLYRSHEVYSQPSFTVKRHVTSTIPQVLDRVAGLEVPYVTLVEIEYTELETVLEYLHNKDMAGLITVKGCTQEQLVQFLREFGIADALCVDSK